MNVDIHNPSFIVLHPRPSALLPITKLSGNSTLFIAIVGQQEEIHVRRTFPLFWIHFTWLGLYFM